LLSLKESEYYMSNNSKFTQPIIGISSSLSVIESGSFLGRERAFVVYDYIQAVVLAGGVPIILPIVDSEEQIATQVQLIDGLLLSGGQDVSPSYYGENPEPALGAVLHERDAHELSLVKIAHQSNKPIFGICRGIQLLNVAFGGTLYQDIASHHVESLQHAQKSRPEAAIHSVNIVEGSLLHRLVGSSLIETNSFHHQVVKTVAPGFTVTAKTDDQLIEAMERDGDRFTLGVQWHPELMHKHHPTMQKLFDGFVDASRKR
jgi:putative glutamine amidotransferase